jgi:hypothetical protein
VQHDGDGWRCLVTSAFATTIEGHFAGMPGAATHRPLRTQKTNPRQGAPVTTPVDRSTRKRMADMSSQRELLAPASYSILALLAEISASPTMT